MERFVRLCRILWKTGETFVKKRENSPYPAFFALDSTPFFRYNRHISQSDMQESPRRSKASKPSSSVFAAQPNMQESPSGMASASQADPGGFDSRFLLHKNKGHSFEGRMLLCLFYLAEGNTSEAEVLPFPAPIHQEMPFRTEGRCSFYKQYCKRGIPWKKTLRRACIERLKEELVPAMGCTEPIAVAYAAALAKKDVGQAPRARRDRSERQHLKERQERHRPPYGGAEGRGERRRGRALWQAMPTANSKCSPPSARRSTPASRNTGAGRPFPSGKLQPAACSTSASAPFAAATPPLCASRGTTPTSCASKKDEKRADKPHGERRGRSRIRSPHRARHRGICERRRPFGSKRGAGAADRIQHRHLRRGPSETIGGAAWARRF